MYNLENSIIKFMFIQLYHFLDQVKLNRFVVIDGYVFGCSVGSGDDTLGPV